VLHLSLPPLPISERTFVADVVCLSRFRPNLVFSGGGSFAEDNWEEIAIGSQDAPTITLVSKCARCLVSDSSSFVFP
jgi:uncharacterized protein YcbX